MKRVFGFDIDGVLYPWHKAVYEYLSATRDLKPYGEFWQDIIDDKSHADELFWKNIIDIDILYSMYAANVKDVKTIKELANDFDIVYITHRPKSTEQTTRNWLRRYDFPYIDNLYVTELSKDIAVRKYNCEYYIDDRIDILTSNLRNVTKLIAMRTLWNWDACETLPYVDSISEIPQLLEEIS